MKLIGHKNQWRFLKGMVEIGRIPHAFLFSGQEQLGKKTLAVEFAKLLIKDNKYDFILVEPESSSQEIQISQIRELIWKLSLRPYSALFKVAVIDKAHQMNREAQNCFLKTLEEPKGKSLLILITQHPELLASTILSRVQKLKFFPVEKKEIKNYLIRQGISQNKAEYLSSLSSGRPGLALNFLADEQKIKDQEKLISDISKISNSDFRFRFQYAKNLSEGEHNIKEILDIWLNYFRKELISKLHQVKSHSIESRTDPARQEFKRVKKIISLIQLTDYLVSTTNINPKLALEILLMEL